MTLLSFKNALTSALLLGAAPALLLAQPPVPAPPAPGTDSAVEPTMLLGPAIAQIRQSLASLHTDKWKTNGSLSQETAQNLGSIQRDLDSTLPGLLATADRNPASVQDVLPAYRNVDALYDVLLRVTEISKLAAPTQQSLALQQATATLEDARRTFGDQVQSAAVNQTKAILTLQTQLRTAQSAAPQVAAATPPACTPAPAPAKKKPAAKPKPKPPATTTANPQ